MQVAEQATADLKGQRNAAIAEAVERVRAVEAEKGVNREALKEIRAILLELATRKELFPARDFEAKKNEQGFDAVYLLSEDADRRFALYLSTGVSGKDVPPHNHTTWAVIVGVEGEEHNRFYERTDDRSEPGRAEVRLTGEKTVRPGTGVCMMPEDIHSIHNHSGRPNRHLHIYGLSLEHLSNRVRYDMKAGTYKVFPAPSHIVEAR